jgi:hypothetical protein
MDDLAAGRVPQPDQAVTSREYLLAVRGEGHAVNHVGVSPEATNLLAGAYIQQPRRLRVGPQE